MTLLPSLKFHFIFNSIDFLFLLGLHDIFELTQILDLSLVLRDYSLMLKLLVKNHSLSIVFQDLGYLLRLNLYFVYLEMF